MNDTDGRAAGIVERQVDSMLRLLRRHESAEVEKILDAAYAAADQRVRAARSEARRRLHEAIQMLRSETDAKMTRLEAGSQAERRQRELEKARQVLAEGRRLLRDRVAARWEDAASRRQWTGALLERAERILPPGEWVVAHPAGWPADEREDFAARVAGIAGRAPTLSPEDGIAAGLRVSRGGATLDGTLQGLTGDASEIPARLLAGYYAAFAGGGGGAASPGDSP